MSCKLSDKCDNVFACNVLRPEVELLGCSFYKPKKPMTNEEWFCQLPTEEKARWLYDHYVNARADEYYGRQEKTLSEYQKWLVSVHRKIDGTKID